MNNASFKNPKKDNLLPFIVTILVLIIFLPLIFSLYPKLSQFSKDKFNSKTSTQTQTPEKQTVAKSIIEVKKYNQDLQKGPFTCPLASSFCKSADYKENSFSANVAGGSAVFASFSGLAEGLLSFHPNDNKTQEEYYMIILSNKERGLMAYYSLKGKAVGKKEVKEGEQIATSSGVPIKFKDNKSFVFELVKFSEKGSIQSPLSKGDFK